MTETELLNWLKEQHATLDAIIAKAGREFHDWSLALRSKDQFGFDLAQCQYESYNLILREDLCYDRPNTALVYSLWYHGRRVNTFLSYFAKTLFHTTDSEIEIFDLGAGTGAVQWAVGLIYHKMKMEGMRVPKIRIVNIDTSPFMLYYSRDFLWKNLLAVYTQCRDFEGLIEYEINSWDNSQKINVTNPWITASYLFDISDASAINQRKNEYREALKAGFRELLKKFAPSTILLLTANQEEKRQLLNEIKEELLKGGFVSRDVSGLDLLLKGFLNNVNLLRKELHELYKDCLFSLPARRNEANSLLNNCGWEDTSFIGTILSKRQVALNLKTENSGEKTHGMDLYHLPIKIRRDVILNEVQTRAAELTDRPTIITGPAGCGKSVVLTEKIKNLVEAREYNPDFRILVTTFNKQLLSYLGNWIEDLLDTNKMKRVGNNFYFGISETANIRLMNFDILPTRLGVFGSTRLIFNSHLRHIAMESIAIIKRENNITTNKHDKVLNPDYIIEEYHRVVYGLQYVTENDYLMSERKGRPKLKKEGENRKLLWKTIWKFLDLLQTRNLESIILRRHKFLKQLQSGNSDIKFTHIFVDEFQDCTQADYQIFDYLVENPNNIVLAGDIAQAVQIGNVADIPRIRTEEMANRKTYYLKGSYRLPFRISECITKISETIQNGSVITPYKGAPPGARPIIVYAKNLDELKTKIESIHKTYSIYGIDRITILECDRYLCNALKDANIYCETDTILKLKGLEKTCVLWATWQDIEYKGEVSEFVYTILSRTSGILIMAITEQTLAKYHRIIKLLQRNRIILWDIETRDNLDRFCNQVQENIVIEEDWCANYYSRDFNYRFKLPGK